MEKLYMVVTADEYELPLFVANKVKDIAKFVDRKVDSVYCSITKGNVDKRLNAKYIKIEL